MKLQVIQLTKFQSLSFTGGTLATGGGTCAKSPCSSGTVPAGCHEAIPAFLTWLCALNCSFCAICCNVKRLYGPVLCPFTATLYTLC